MMNKIISIIPACLILTAGISASASAALSTGSILNFDAGVTTTNASGVVVSVDSGSYFGMDFNINGEVEVNERTAISQNDGLIVGAVQAASGSHAGVPDGTELPGIDQPWEFFGNTGMHYTALPSQVLSDDGLGGVTLDFSGWSVAWNGFDSNLGSGAWQAGFSDSVAQVSCAVDCRDGDTFTLDYSATVFTGGFSGKGNAKYSLHLEGTISAVPVPAAIWLFGAGLLGLAGVARRRKAS